MKRNLGVIVAAVALVATGAHAADGTWSANASGNWKTQYVDPEVNPWAGGVVAQGADFTAYFQTEITDHRTVTLAESFTIGNLYFEDTPTISHNWTLASSGGSVLTLSTTTGTPTITVMGGTARTTTITADIAGTQGLTKLGTGTLFLSGAKSFSGNMTISAGRVQVNNNSSLGVGSTITLAGGTLGVNGWYHTANLSQAINVTANSGLWTGSAESSLTLSGQISIASGAVLQGDFNGGTTINQAIVGDGELYVNAGPLTLNYANTIARVRISSGTLRIGNDAALGGQFSLAHRDAAVTITSTDATARTIATPFTLSGKSGYSTTFGQTSGGTGNLTFTGNGTLATMRAVVHNTTEFSGDISGTAALNLFGGAGTFILSGNNTFGGTIAVNAATLLVNNTAGSGTGTSSVTVGAAGRLGGTGTISGAVSVAGVLAPGKSAGILSTGNLTITGTLSAEANGATVGTEYDQVNVTGTVNLGAASNLEFILGFAPTGSEQFVLINNDGADAIIGSFASVNGVSLAGGNTFTANYGGTDYQFTLDYAGGDGNDLVVVIPEPATLGLLGAASLMVMARRRRVR